jgi:hypothetical protein
MKIPIPTVAVEIEGNVVRLELTFRDSYEAVVYRDDLCERFESGKGVTMTLKCPPQKGVVERAG